MSEKSENEAGGVTTDVWSLLDPIVAAQAMEILEVEYRRESIGWVLRIYIDSDNGVSVDDCAAISRIAGDALDVADIIAGSYHLEVSSPGLNRPLRKWEHFQKQVGRIVEIRTTSPLDQQATRRNFKGILKDVSTGGVIVECDGKEHHIPLDLIERARLLYFDSQKLGQQ